MNFKLVVLLVIVLLISAISGCVRNQNISTTADTNTQKLNYTRLPFEIDMRSTIDFYRFEDPQKNVTCWVGRSGIASTSSVGISCIPNWQIEIEND